ncbi:MAG TPA: hypothetical protein DCQ33_16490, partial [Nitrospira sp.]|nr:hypothetical protein [Nitrospira sp.]
MERVMQARAGSPQQEGTLGSCWTGPSMGPPVGGRDGQPEEGQAASRPPRIEHHIGRCAIFPPAGTHGGKAEPVPYRASMERAFQADLSDVRAFRGASVLLAGAGARAAAWPETLAFVSLNPPPRIVAHEVAHVLQYRKTPSPIAERRGLVSRRDPAEAEAGRAAGQFESDAPIRVQARPSVAPMYYTDEEEPDSKEFLEERPPLFVGEEVGSWGSSWPATLIARERLAVSVPEGQRSHAIVEAIALREPIVILHEYGRLWLYRLEWEGLSGRYSRFTNAETIFHKGTNERGDYSVSNVLGRPEVEAFVTEDGGVLSPPGAGRLFSHTGGEFEDPLVSKFQNASAFLDGMGRGLEGAGFEALAERLRRMAALNVVFPAPFAIGAVRG